MLHGPRPSSALERRLQAKKAAVDAEWEAELEKAWEDIERLEQGYREAEITIEQLSEEKHRLEDELDAVGTQMAEIGRFQGVIALTPEGQGPPVTVLQAVERAAAECQLLVFLPDAYRSASASNFPRPESLYEDLLRLDEVAARWASGGMNGTPWDVAFTDAGLSNFLPNVGEHAHGQFRSDYERPYNGERILLAPHLKYGTNQRTGLRVYWYVDDTDKVFVVGHVGDKLRDTTNQ